MSLREERIDKLILDSFIKFVIESNLVTQQDIETSIDTTIGAYIVNTIKQFYEEYESHKIWLNDSRAENFDLDNFIEIIDAYLSGFNSLKCESITKWLIKLKNEIDISNKQIEQPINNAQSKQIQEITSADCSNQSKSNTLENMDENVKLLVEMFPEMNVKEINKVYKKMSKNYEKTIDELLYIQNSGIIPNEIVVYDKEHLTEEERIQLKEKTVKKFGLVEVDQDGMPIEVKPKVNWNSEKKLIRYFDSKVVTTRGDKYFEPKTEQDEEMEKQMKKTYVNLKPARKYRFH